jgi:hypothetical protein
VVGGSEHLGGESHPCPPPLPTGAIVIAAGPLLRLLGRALPNPLPTRRFREVLSALTERRNGSRMRKRGERGSVAQRLERTTHNGEVGGSNPPGAMERKPCKRVASLFPRATLPGRMSSLVATKVATTAASRSWSAQTADPGSTLRRVHPMRGSNIGCKRRLRGGACVVAVFRLQGT